MRNVGRFAVALVMAPLVAACGRSELLLDDSAPTAPAADARPDADGQPDALFSNDATIAGDSGKDARADARPPADAASSACAQTCRIGCCDADGACQAGTATGACGGGGSVCFDCGSIGQACDPLPRGGGACSASTACGAGNCFGCCQGDTCIDAVRISVDACGSFGQPCVTCALGEICKGECARPQQDCGPSNCAGCCGGSTSCHAGTADVECGAGGAQCSRCVPTEGTGQCIANAGGQGGACTSDLCGPGTCFGCCANGVCISGETASACGGQGRACSVCGADEACIRGACTPGTPCSPTTCAGCCGGDDGNTCQPGNDPRFGCGMGGNACVGCQTFGDVCVNGTCVPPASCAPANCHGCCYGTVCAEGDQRFLCGANGVTCVSCEASGTQCLNGTCQ